MSKLDFIGSGVVGAPMSQHFINDGHEVYLQTRSGVAATLTEAGGIECETGKEVAQKAHIIFTMLLDKPHEKSVLFGQDGVAEGLVAVKIMVDMSSIPLIATMGFAQEIEALGVNIWMQQFLVAHGGAGWDHSAIVRATEIMGNHELA